MTWVRSTNGGSKQTIFIGDRFELNHGWATVVDYRGKDNIFVRFDNTGSISVGTSHEVRSKTLRDKIIPTHYGVGCIGYGDYGSVNQPHLYSIWGGVMERCYSEDFALKHPTYADCTMSKEWLNFQTFCSDALSMEFEKGWEIDKDLLIKGNRVYSKDSCVFLPRAINVHFRKRLGRMSLPIGGVC